MKSSMCRGVDRAKEDSRVWIIQDEKGEFQNIHLGFGTKSGVDVMEYDSYAEAIKQAKGLCENYRKDFYIFELTDHVKHKSLIEIENLRK